MKKLLTLSLAFGLMLLGSQVYAGELVVRSRAGMPIFLSINQVPQNDRPRHEVRVRDLDRRFYDIQIDFPDRRMPSLRADRFRLDPRQRTILEVTRNRRGEMLLTLVATEPLGYVTPVRPGPPRPQPAPVYPDPYLQDPYAFVTPMAISPMEFAQLRRSLAEVTFERDRVALAHQALAHRYLLTEQVFELMQLYTFDRNRLEVAKIAYDRTIDPENYYLLHEAFTFRSHAQELREYVLTHPHPGFEPVHQMYPPPHPRPAPFEPGRRQPRRAW